MAAAVIHKHKVLPHVDHDQILIAIAIRIARDESSALIRARRQARGRVVAEMTGTVIGPQLILRDTSGFGKNRSNPLSTRDIEALAAKFYEESSAITTVFTARF